MITKLNLNGRSIYENTAIAKVNEIIDLLNAIVVDVDGIKCVDGSKAPTDSYAEQRKWIGKICKFWNWDTGLAHYSKFITIKDINDGEMSNCPFRADDGGWYMHCEPVKPDSEIIYHGE